MSEKKKSSRRKDTTRYYDQSDWMRPVGLGCMIAAVALFYFGFSSISYYLASLLMPLGIFLFFYASVRHITDADVEKERDKLLEGFDSSVTEMENYDRIVLRQPADLLTDGWLHDSPATYFRRNKNGAVISDRFVRSHLFFTKEALLVCSREVSITEMDAETGAGVTDRNQRIPFPDIKSARLDETPVTVTLTKGNKPATVRTCTLVIEGEDGELLRLPVHNDMDSATFCEALARMTT